MMISNNVPTTAPLITATLTESSPSSLAGTVGATVATVNSYKMQVSHLSCLAIYVYSYKYITIHMLIRIPGLTGSSLLSAMDDVGVARVCDDVIIGDVVGVVDCTVKQARACIIYTISYLKDLSIQ